MSTVEFAFLLDEKEAPNYLARSAFATLRCPTRYLQGQNRQNSIHEFLISYDDKDSSCVFNGVLFIR